jgi:hypothetical protein
MVRGYAPADAGRDGGAMQLKASGAGRPRVPARRSGDHAEQRADRGRRTLGHPRFKGRPAPRVHSDRPAERSSAVGRCLPGGEAVASVFD